MLGDSPIDVFAIANFVDRDFFRRVIYLVRHSIVSVPHTVQMTESGELFAAVRTRVVRQRLNLSYQSLSIGLAANCQEFLPGRGLDLDLI